MTTNKKNIAKNISINLFISIKEGSNILESFLSLIKVNSKNKIVKLSGFGSFDNKKSPERLGRNPKTKESYIIQPTTKPKFKASKKIKEILN